MGKLLKILAGFILVIIVIAIAAPLIIDPNDYRDQIQTTVKEKTGRDLKINGDLSLSVFPWIGVAINDVSLSNAKGFKADYFAKIENAKVQVKLLPLISKKVEVSTIVLNGMQLNLAKNKQGITNWDDLSQAKQSEQNTTPDKSESSSSTGLAALAIGGVQINNANIHWDDASSGETQTISNFNLTTDALSLGSPMGVELGFTLKSNKPVMETKLELKGDLVINNKLNKFEFQNMALLVDSSGDPIPNGKISVNINSNIIADLANSGSLSLKPLTISFNETTIKGSALVKNFAKPAINFDLAADTINIDQYLSQTDDGANTSQKKPVAATPAAAALIPVETLRPLDIDGLIKIESAIVSGLKADGVSLKIDAKNGILKTQQEVKTFYNGSYLGKTTIDSRHSTPKITLQEQAKDINIEALLVDLSGQSSLSGTANIKANLTTQGNTIAAFKSTLNGTSNFSFKDGAITGVDVGALMKQAEAVLKGDLSALAEKGTGKTPFTDISGSAKITRGLVNNNDLIIATPLVNITGKGTANLVNEKIDYRLAMQRTKAQSDAEKADVKDIKNTAIPVDISGTFTKPSFKLDIESIVLSSQKEKIEEKKQELKNKLQDKIGDKLGDKFKSFF